MNHIDVIDWKLSNLADGSNQPITSQLADYIEKHPDLQNEMEFIDQLWSVDVEQEQTPSAQMDANFYQMLSKAQAAQPRNKSTSRVNSSWMSVLKQWFFTQPVAQFAALGLVFTIGVNVNDFWGGGDDNQAITYLQQEVSSLNTMLAISLLDKNSASERLSGVAYSKTSDLTNPILKSKLISLIQSDKSTSVRLAVLDRLAELSSIEEYSNQLVKLALNETNVLVQLSLCQLLMNNGSLGVQQELKKLLNDQDLPQEVRDVLQTRSTRSFT